MRTVSLLALCLCYLSVACDPAPSSADTQNTGGKPAPQGTTPMPDDKHALVRLMKADGTLTEPVIVPKLILSDEQWKARLTPEQYRILRNKGTEPAFCGNLLDNKKPGVYACIGCSLPLFEHTAKFNSGTGWPSFFKPIAEENVVTHEDRSHGMIRTEILCARCDGHLGHVFDDGPRPTGLRYCLNSESLRFVDHDQRATLAEKIPPQPATRPAPAASADRAEAVFAGGCFWCVEAVFEQLDGVYEAISGYSGGTRETANYEAVCSGTTGHAEAVKIIYNPRKITYEQLLKVHFATHDPTTLNRQGNDVGPQYRSAIFYANEREKQIAEAFIADLTAAKVYGGKKIVTTLEPLTGFYEAEKYHQDFVACNPQQGYVRAVALPKVEKVKEKFRDMLKRDQQKQTSP